MKVKIAAVVLIFGWAMVLSAQPKTKKIIAKPIQLTSKARGEKVYTQYCLTCHMADGGGVQNMNPPLSRTSYVLGDKNRLIKVVLNGLSGKEIDDERYSNNMASQSFLKDQEIADVLTYIRKSFNNNAIAITAPQVKTIRTTVKK